MSILFSGYLHTNDDGQLFSITKRDILKKYKREKYEAIEYHIILGDAGFLWPGQAKRDKAIFAQLSERPFPILCVAGDLDPILGMDNVAEKNIDIGEKVLVVNEKNPFVAYLKRGKVYTIDGIKFLVLGGALCPCKIMWEHEYWTEQEKQDVFKLLETENSFDFVLSHTGPHHINKLLFPDPPKVNRRQKFEHEGREVMEKISDTDKLILDNGEEIPFYEYLVAEEQEAHNKRLNDEVAFLNDEIHEKIQFREWWCGHWYQNKYHCDKATGRGYHYLHGGTKILARLDTGMVVYNEYGRV